MGSPVTPGLPAPLLKENQDMDIIVLMKQVPDTEAPVEIASCGTCLDTEELKWAINPYDEFALEEALLIKERRDDVTVTVLTVGPERVSEAIRVAYAMGVDTAIHIDDEVDEGTFAATDAHTTSTILATALKEMPCDLIIAGARAVDDDNYQVPALISKMCGMPMVNLVTKLTLEDGAIVCEQAVDGGTAVVKASRPAIITANRGLNDPRYPNFRAIMKAKKKKVDTRDIEGLGLDPEALSPKVKIRTLEYPARRGDGKVVPGRTPEEKAKELVRLLKEEARII